MLGDHFSRISWAAGREKDTHHWEGEDPNLPLHWDSRTCPRFLLKNKYRGCPQAPSHLVLVFPPVLYPSNTHKPHLNPHTPTHTASKDLQNTSLQNLKFQSAGFGVTYPGSFSPGPGQMSRPSVVLMSHSSHPPLYYSQSRIPWSGRRG